MTSNDSKNTSPTPDIEDVLRRLGALLQKSSKDVHSGSSSGSSLDKSELERLRRDVADLTKSLNENKLNLGILEQLVTQKSNEMVEVTKTADETKDKMIELMGTISTIHGELKTLNDTIPKLVTKDSFQPVKTIVYSLVGIILLAVLITVLKNIHLDAPEFALH